MSAVQASAKGVSSETRCKGKLSGFDFILSRVPRNSHTAKLHNWISAVHIQRAKSKRDSASKDWLRLIKASKDLNSILACCCGHDHGRMSGGEQSSPAFVIWGYLKKY